MATTRSGTKATKAVKARASPAGSSSSSSSKARHQRHPTDQPTRSDSSNHSTQAQEQAHREEVSHYNLTIVQLLNTNQSLTAENQQLRHEIAPLHNIITASLAEVVTPRIAALEEQIRYLKENLSNALHDLDQAQQSNAAKEDTIAFKNAIIEVFYNLVFNSSST
jgi:cell division protein FtsB